MADVEELRILIRTQAETQGATQTRDALRQTRLAAQQHETAATGASRANNLLGGSFSGSASQALRLGSALFGVTSVITIVAAEVQQLANVLASVADTGIKFEAAMAGVGAVSGATADQLARLSELARVGGRDLGIGSVEGAKGLQELSKGGVSTEAALNGALRATETLAKAGGVELATAAEISATALNSFGLSASQLAHVADLVAGAANASSIGVDDFRQSLSQVGAVARTAGVSFDDTAVAIAELGQAGIKGSDAGTSLRTFLLSLTPSSQQATDEMKRLGIITADGANRFFDASGKAKGMADVSQVLKTSLAGMTDQQKLASLQIIFGTDALRAAAIFTREGASGFDHLAASMAKVSAADVARKQLNSLNGDLQILQAQAEATSVSLEKVFDPALRGGTKAIANVLQRLETAGGDVARDLALAAALGPAGAPLAAKAAGHLALAPGPSGQTDFSQINVEQDLRNVVQGQVVAEQLAVQAAAARKEWEQLGSTFRIVDETFQHTHATFAQIVTDLGTVQSKAGQLTTILGSLGAGDVGASAAVSVQRDLAFIDARTVALQSEAEAQRVLNQEQEATKILDPRDAAGSNAAKQRVDAARQLLPLEQAVAEAKRQQADISSAITNAQASEAAILLQILPQHQEIARLERSKADAINRGLQLRQEETRLLAQQAALGPQGALDDTQAKIQRDKLVLGDLSQTPDARRQALRESIDLQGPRGLVHRQELQAFDANEVVRQAQKAENATNLGGQIGTNRIDQQIFAIGQSVKKTDDLVFALNQNTDRLNLMGQVAAAISAAAEKKVQVVISGGIGVSGGGAQGTAREITDRILAQMNDQIFGQLTEAVGQAALPPAIQQSGVRR